MTLDEILRSLGWQDGEFTAVCHKPVGGQFSSSVVESAKATARVESLAAQAGPRIIRVDLDEVESLFRPIPTAACWGR